MIKNLPERLRGERRRIVVAIVSIMLPLAIAAPAVATTHHPTGDFAAFADCPLSNPIAQACVYAKTESGKFIVGKETVPIEKTITLQGAYHENASEVEEFIGAEDGNTLSKTPQSVPGGLAGLVNCKEISNFIERVACELTFENGVTGVLATTELAQPATSIGISTANLTGGHDTALSLPVKVHLENPFLGSSCYIGSNSHPIVIALTTGTTSPPPPNSPITGKIGEFEFKDEFTLIIDRNNELVNNSFAAPGAEGCGGLFAFLVDPIVDAKLGLPATAGHNTAALKGTLEVASAPAVKASE
jgi:hypothetical protein